MNNELPPPDGTDGEPRLIKPFGPYNSPIIEPTPEELADIDAWRSSTYQPKKEETPPDV